MAPKQATYGEVTMEKGDDHVATVEFHRPPNNFFDVDLVRCLGDALEDLEDDLDVRAVVLCSEGKHFCAGANFGGGDRASAAGAEPRPDGTNPLYAEALRCFRTSVPIVAAVQGAAVGGGLGVALLADFRVAAPEARFASNFARLGFHQGFGLSVTLPYVVGNQKALELLYTGKRITGEQALAIGLADRLAPLDSVRDEARALAAEIAGSPVPPGRPQDHAGRPRGRRGQGHRARVHRAGPAAADQGLHRGIPAPPPSAASPSSPASRRVRDADPAGHPDPTFRQNSLLSASSSHFVTAMPLHDPKAWSNWSLASPMTPHTAFEAAASLDCCWR